MTKRVKIILLFLIATSSLLLSGYLISPVNNWKELSALLWLGICGTICIYGIDIERIDPSGIKSISETVLNTTFKKIFLFQFVFFTIPLCLIYIPLQQLFIFASICVLGWLYSARFQNNGKMFRVKDTTLLKNIFIGFGWGALVLAGSGSIGEKEALAVFMFTSLQIVIGSIIRDISDMESDREAGMRTVPLIFGVEKTLSVLHVANLLTFLPSFFLSQHKGLLILMLLIIVWKALIIIKVKKDNTSRLWTQTLNIMVCFFIFILILLKHSYELYR